MCQVSRVAEFTPCLLQIVLDNVDLPVRQAGKLTHVSKLCHACVCTAANTVFPVIIMYVLMYTCGLRIVTRGGVLVPGTERRSHLMAHPHRGFRFIVQFVSTVTYVMYRLCYTVNPQLSEPHWSNATNILFG